MKSCVRRGLETRLLVRDCFLPCCGCLENFSGRTAVRRMKEPVATPPFDGCETFYFGSRFCFTSRAVEEYKTALRYDPLHADTMCNLGSALQDLGDYPLSRQEACFWEGVRGRGGRGGYLASVVARGVLYCTGCSSFSIVRTV